MTAAANIEDLYEALRALPVSERLRLIERLAHQAAEEIAAGSAVAPASGRGRGFDSGRAKVADDFDAPLPDDLQAAFDGGGHGAGQ